MQRSSSLIRPLKSGSFVKDKVDHKKTDDLPVFTPINIKASPPKKSSSKSQASKSKKYFVIFIVFALLIIGIILHRIFLTISYSYPKNGTKKSFGNGSAGSNANINNSKAVDPNSNMVVDSSKVEGKSNRNVIAQTSGEQANKSGSKSDSKKKSNLRKIISKEELESEYERELAINPALENLDEEEVKKAIEEGKIEEAVEEANEIEDILQELQEIRKENKQRGFRGKKD